MGTGTYAIFSSDVPSPLDDERRSIAVTLFPGWFFLPNKDRKANEKILNREAALRDIQKDCCKADYISRWFRGFFFRIHRGNS